MLLLPLLRVAFFVHGRSLLSGVFVCMGDVWVATPHFSLHQLKFHEKGLDYLREAIPGKDWQKEDALRAVYNYLVDAENLSDGKSLRVDLDPEDYFTLANQELKKNRNKLFIRGKEAITTKHFFKTMAELDLKSQFSEQMKALRPSVRRKIRKAHKNGLQIEKGHAALLQEWYPVYRSNIHRLGSFGLTYTFFKELLENDSSNTFTVFLAKKEDKALGGAILMLEEPYAENTWFATTSEGNRLYASYFLHEHMIRHAIEHKCRVYSLGRSTAGGSVEQYKKQWGVRLEPLYYNTNYTVNRGIVDVLQKIARKVLPLLPQRLMMKLDKYMMTRYY